MEPDEPLFSFFFLELLVDDRLIGTGVTCMGLSSGIEDILVDFFLEDSAGVFDEVSSSDSALDSEWLLLALPSESDESDAG